MLLGYLQGSIANMQDHPQPSLTILDFRLEEGLMCYLSPLEHRSSKSS